VVERRDHDAGPVPHLIEDGLLPSPPLHFQNHHRAAAKRSEIGEPLDYRSAFRALRERQRLDLVFAQLVVMEEHGGAVEEQPQVGLEAVRTRAQSLLE
jgi:hypothetical protein